MLSVPFTVSPPRRVFFALSSNPPVRELPAVRARLSRAPCRCQIEESSRNSRQAKYLSGVSGVVHKQIPRQAVSPLLYPAVSPSRRLHLSREPENNLALTHRPRPRHRLFSLPRPRFLSSIASRSCPASANSENSSSFR